MEFLVWLCIWPLMVSGFLMVVGAVVLYASGYRLTKKDQKKKGLDWECYGCGEENSTPQCGGCGLSRADSQRMRSEDARRTAEEARKRRIEAERQAQADGVVTDDERRKIEAAKAAEQAAAEAARRAAPTVACPRCGVRNPNGATFCSACGVKIHP
jgi:ribosomal protein L40E